MRRSIARSPERGVAIALALVLAVRGALMGLFFLALLVVSHPRWN